MRIVFRIILFVVLIIKSTFLVSESVGRELGLDSQPYSVLGKPTLSSSDLSDNGATLFEVRFNNLNYTGDLIARSVSDAGLVTEDEFADSGLISSDKSEWRASRKLIGQTPGSRNIFTNDVNGNSYNLVWGSLPDSIKNKIDPLADDKDNSNLVLDWARGSSANEGTGSKKFRERDAKWIGGATFHNKLGAIVSSSPAYVGPPSKFYSFDDYRSFRRAYSKRTPMVYIGANDGMLHAFNATTGDSISAGKEVFAYAPNSTLDKLRIHAEKENETQVYSVDGSPVVADAFGQFPKCGPAKCWRTILVSGLNGGGRGIFALDVTDPVTETASGAKSLFLWEMMADDRNDDGEVNAADGHGNEDLGYTFSKPIIAQLQDGTWVAIFGNGYNGSGSGKASLFVVDLATGKRIAKIEVSRPAGLRGLEPNGLSSVTGWDSNFDEKVDYVYAGDLDGNLWKFDLSTADAASPTSIKTAFSGDPLIQVLSDTNDADGNKIFTPISAPPTLTLSPTGGVIVYFGTGIALDGIQELVEGTRGVFGIFDDGDNKADGPKTPPYGVFGGGAKGFTLTRHSIGTNNAGQLRGISATTASNDGVGWNIKLPVKEQVLSEFGLSSQRLSLVTTESIADVNNFNWLYSVDFLTGSAPTVPVFDVNDDGAINASDKISLGTGGSVVSIGGALGKAIASPPKIAVNKSGKEVFIVTLGIEIFTGFDNPFDDKGLPGGHFDQDEHFNPKYKFTTPLDSSSDLFTEKKIFQKAKHDHEYDDKNDTNGVQLLTNESQSAVPAIPPNVETSNGLGKGYMGLVGGIEAGKFKDADGNKLALTDELVISVINPHSVDTLQWSNERFAAGVSDKGIAPAPTIFFVCNTLPASKQYPSGADVPSKGGISAPEFELLSKPLRTCKAGDLTELKVRFNDINAMRASSPGCVRKGLKSGKDGPVLPPTNLLSDGQKQNTNYRNGALVMQAAKTNGDVVWENYNYEHLKDLTDTPKGRGVDCDEINEDLRQYRTLPDSGDLGGGGAGGGAGGGGAPGGGAGIDTDRLEKPGEGGFQGFIGEPVIIIDPYSGRSHGGVPFDSNAPESQRVNWREILKK